MTPLETEIRAMIAQEGPMPLERYMALALGHPTLGYYMTRDPFGASGDFVTAPEISQMFGELLGLWAAEVWTMMGAPAPVRLVELGPGRGALIADALRAAAVAPAFRAAVSVELVETSPALRKRQAAALAGVGLPVAWRERLEDVPDGPMIVLANEFFDALPVRHYVRVGEGWRERLVGLGPDGALAFGVAPFAEPAIAVPAPEGAVMELSPIGHRVAATLARRLARDGGAALIVDYGHLRSGFGETLQAVRAHRYADPLRDVGEADLTAHVDFASLGEAARRAGAAVHGPIAQGALLRRLGLAQRAERLARGADEAGARAIAAATHRLAGAGADAMGELFKAVAFAHPDLPAPPGFETQGAPPA
ncbi:MAG: SAM-dependent methyltransferase [Methylobacteriaceae bacterium]|nr:SAM-dependent methyltransferase [Methylobacteriaceae bacterium]